MYVHIARNFVAMVFVGIKENAIVEAMYCNVLRNLVLCKHIPYMLFVHMHSISEGTRCTIYICYGPQYK